MTVCEIIKHCGGPGTIAEASNGTFTPSAVKKWRSIGIPEQRWQLVISLFEGNLTATELHNANQALRTAQPTKAA